MKTIYLSVAATIISLAACSQDIPSSEVPSVVLNAVQSKHPGVDVEWEKKKDVYEAEFKIGGVEYSLYIDANGKLLRKEQEIKNEELPAPVQSAIKTQHKDFVIDDAKRVEKDGQVYYKVELEAKGKKDIKLFFLPDGKTIKNI